MTILDKLKHFISCIKLKEISSELEMAKNLSLREIKMLLESARKELAKERELAEDLEKQIDELDNCHMEEVDSRINRIAQLNKALMQGISFQDRRLDELKDAGIEIDTCQSKIDLWGYVVLQLRTILRQRARNYFPVEKH